MFIEIDRVVETGFIGENSRALVYWGMQSKKRDLPSMIPLIEPATQSEDSRDSFGSRRNSCSSQQEGYPLRRYPSSFDELVRVSEENEDGATRDLLIKEYIYCQTFAVREESRESFEDHLDGYLRYMLNDLGMYFYKATWYCSLQPRSDLDGLGELPHRLYSIHFALFSNRHFTEPQPGQAVSKKSEVEAPEFLRDHLSQQQDYDHAHFRSKVMAEQKTITRSRDYRPQQMPEEVTAGSYTGLFKNPIKSFIHWWLIVPSVQYRFFDLLYQLYTFDIAHQGFWPKFLHMFTIHTNVICTMTFLAQWKFYESLGEDRTVINASFIYLSILIIAYVVMGFLRKSVVWGFTTAFVLVLCWAISNLWFDFFAVPGNPIYNPTTWGTNPLIWLYISSLVESTSHIMVPQLPPYITGVNHWESPFTFVKSGNWLYIIPSILSFVFFAPAVSYISHPHLVGTAIIVVMFGLGYHEEFYSEYKRMVMKAELCGNPAMDQVPIEFKDLIHGGPGNSGAPRQNPVEKIMFWTGIQRGPFDSLPAFLLPKQGVD